MIRASIAFPEIDPSVSISCLWSKIFIEQMFMSDLKKMCIFTLLFQKRIFFFAWAHRICQSKGTPIHKSLSIISYRGFFFWLFPLNTFHWISQAQMTANNSRPTILSTEIFRHLNGVLKKSRLGYFLIRFCDPEHLMQQKNSARWWQTIEVSSIFQHT